MSLLASAIMAVKVSLLAVASAAVEFCTPGDACWPTRADFIALNASLDGQLFG